MRPSTALAHLFEVFKVTAALGLVTPLWLEHH